MKHNPLTYQTSSIAPYQHIITPFMIAYTIINGTNDGAKHCWWKLSELAGLNSITHRSCNFAALLRTFQKNISKASTSEVFFNAMH